VRFVIPSRARNLIIEAKITLIELCDTRVFGRPFTSFRMTMHNLKFVGAVRAENEFKLKKDRIDVAIGEKKVFVEKVVIVLQADL
jgi:hypothetical protein